VAEAYDAVIVGSGATGSWAAKELTESGVTVAVLEAGPLFPMDVDQLALMDVDLKKRQAVQSTSSAFNKYTSHLFVDDVDNPYAVPKEKPFRWIRSRLVGGRLHVWGLVALRMSDYEFKAASRDGAGEDWPISYANLAPYYSHVERYLSVSGTKQELPQLPDGEFLPAPRLTPGAEKLKNAISTTWTTRRLTNARLARRSADTMLSDAMRTGRLTLYPNSIVSQIMTDRQTGKARGVAFVDRLSNAGGAVEGRVVVLCASAIESTRILLNSATSDQPEGLGNSSGVLGHYLMDHIVGMDVTGHARRLLPQRHGRDRTGQRAYIPPFRNITENGVDFVRSYGIELEVHPPRGPQANHFWMGAFGEVLPAWDNHVSLDPVKKDAWGIPVARIECAYGDNEHRMARDASGCLKELAEVAGFHLERISEKILPPGSSAHEMGTARMGKDRESSVLNQYNQSWDVKNLFVTDGACFTSSGFQNPTLTMMAITARACRYIVEQLRRGAL
jgi:choline dehydrogenase-like flavoprotein